MQAFRTDAQDEITRLREENAQLRRALAEAEETSAALGAGRVGTWSWDVATDAVLWSPNVEGLFGLQPGSFPGTAEAFFALIHPGDRDRFNIVLSQALGGGEGQFDVIHRSLGTDGTVRWFACVGAVDRDEVGRPARVRGSVRELVRTSATALAESEERYRGVVDSLDEGVIMHADTGRIIGANASASRILGLTEEELLDRTAADPRWRSVREDGSPLPREDEPSLRTLATGVRCTNVTLGVHRPDGALVWLSVNSEPLFRPGAKQPYATISSFHDVTERRRLFEQLVQSQKMEGLGRLAGGVAHDFNNLLTVILSYAQLLSSSLPAGDPRAEEVTQILRAGDSATRLVRQLLAFARQQPAAPRTVDVRKLVEQSRALLGRLAGNDVEIAVEGEATSWPVRIDPTHLEQVLLNLTVNARDAMPDGGRITLRVRGVQMEAPSRDAGLSAGAHVVLEVADTGQGMSEEVRRRAFEPFFSTKDAERGTGLGLATCWGVVKQAGGHIEIESQEGRGTLMRVLLPVAPGHEILTVAEGGLRPASHPAGGTVLVVEDDPLVRGVVQRILRGHGYQVLSAAHGQDALAQARTLSAPVDLVIADLVLPRQSGEGVWNQLRGEGLARRALFMSGRSVEGLSETLLSKPFTAEELARRVREVLDRPVA